MRMKGREIEHEEAIVHLDATTRCERASTPDWKLLLSRVAQVAEFDMNPTIPTQREYERERLRWQ